MARLQFKQLDVESMAKLYGQKEPKQKATQLKRQYQRGEQRQQSPIPPSMLPPALELDFGTLITSETQPTTHTSAASGNFCGVNGQDRTEVDWNQEPNDVARILYPMAPPFGIGPITEASMNRSSLDETASPPEFCLPHTPLPVQLPSEQSSRKEPSHYYQELFLFPDLGKSSMAQIHPASRLASNMNTAIPGDHESRESGKSYESCGDDDPASSNCSSADGETHGQSYSQESMGSGPERTSQDLPGTAASQVVPGSMSVSPSTVEGSSGTASPIPSCAVGVCTAPMNSGAESQANVSPVPTPSSHGDTSASGRKRSHKALEDDCERHDRHSPKRKRSRNICMEAATSALAARTLRTIPSRASVDEPGQRAVTSQSDRQLRRSPRRQLQVHAARTVCFGNDPLRPEGPPLRPPDMDQASKRRKRSGRRRESLPSTAQVTSPRPDCSLEGSSHQTSEQLPIPPAVTSVDSSSVACNNCVLSAKLLLRIIDIIQVLSGSDTELSGNDRASDLLQLCIGFIRDHAKNRLSHNTTSNPCDKVNTEPEWDSVVGVSSLETANNDESSEDNSEDNGGSDSESVGSDYGASTILHSQKAKSGKRRHWTPLEELRLRAWYKEEKDPRWMARKLGRPKGGVEQHWKKICTQDKKGRK